MEYFFLIKKMCIDFHTKFDFLHLKECNFENVELRIFIEMLNFVSVRLPQRCKNGTEKLYLKSF